MDITPGEFEDKKKSEKKDKVTTDLDEKRQVSKNLMDQINALPKLLRNVAKDYLIESNFPSLRQICKNNYENYKYEDASEYYKAVTAMIVRHREKENGADFMAILLEIEKELDKQRGPLARAMLYEIGIEDKNLTALDLFLRHMKKETKDDRRAILTPIDLPDED